MNQVAPKDRRQWPVYSFYRFVPLAGPESLRDAMLEKMFVHGLVGTILLAREGINGTVSGNPEETGGFLAWLQTFPGLSDMDVRKSWAAAPPFKRARVKLKREIVTMGVPGIDPRRRAGDYVEPEAWNDLLDDPGVLVVDARNDYEVKVGRFDNAVIPHITRFREFPGYAREHLAPGEGKRIAMYCTGGIRCEKSTAFLKQQGFEEVYHLKGGILNYLCTVPREKSRWRGECFVFDDRVTVDQELEAGSYDQCHACRLPLDDADKAHELYRKGVSCPYCAKEKSDRDRVRYAERERQVLLAEKRGEAHIGPQTRGR